MSRYFSCENASRPLEANGIRVTFQGCSVFAGTVRGIFRADNDKESSRLLIFATDQSTGVSEISEQEYLRQLRRAPAGFANQSLEILRETPEEWWNQVDYPAFSEQTKWKSGLFPLAPSYQCADFNCSVVEIKGKRFLITRKSERKHNGLLDSSLVVYPIGPNYSLGREIRLSLPESGSPAEQFEDPRAVVYRDKIYVSYCSWNRSFYLPRQIFARFNLDWRWEQSWKVPFGNNGLPAHGQEKNWIWFNHGDQWQMIYKFNPHTVSMVCDGYPAIVSESKIRGEIPWKYGEIRGGTNPVRVGDEYFSFFHSSLPWTSRQRRYFMGAYAFNARPPFEITRMTTEPLLAGSDKDTRVLQMPLVVFPCGALYRDKSWLVTMGINDEACGWIEIPHQPVGKKDGLIKRMVRV